MTKRPTKTTNSATTTRKSQRAQSHEIESAVMTVVDANSVLNRIEELISERVEPAIAKQMSAVSERLIAVTRNADRFERDLRTQQKAVQEQSSRISTLQLQADSIKKMLANPETEIEKFRIVSLGVV